MSRITMKTFYGDDGNYEDISLEDVLDRMTDDWIDGNITGANISELRDACRKLLETQTKEQEMDKKMDSQNFAADFGTAIRWLKAGKKVARRGWNGKNMWLVFMPPFRVEEPNERTQAHVIKEVFGCGVGYIVMWTAQGVWQPGWLASQQDVLSEDWGVVE